MHIRSIGVASAELENTRHLLLFGPAESQEFGSEICNAYVLLSVR